MHELVQRWLDRDPDPQTHAEATRLGDEATDLEIERRFGRRLAFGTAGLRGLLGCGWNRMNRLVVREFRGVSVTEKLEIELRASRGVPVLSGVEVIAEDGGGGLTTKDTKDTKTEEEKED